MGSGHEALRKGRASIAGQIYLVTFTTYGRVPHFTDPDIARDTCALLTGGETWRDGRLLCWVLMPDHWHGLVQLGECARLPERVQQLKGASSRALRRTHPGLPRIWASGYHDHALRAEENMLAVARYVVANPLRAGLARSVGDYPYWDAIWLQDA